ncbi:MAG: histidine kinase [Rectinemataceae bacterium]
MAHQRYEGMSGTMRMRFLAGIRGRILGFYGATLLAVVALELFSWNSAVNSAREYESRLARYYAIQGLRSSIAETRARGEQFMRERLPEQASAIGLLLDDIGGAVGNLEALPDEALFEERAALRGIEAWIPGLREALAGRARGELSAYQVYLRADRTAAFVDGYLGKLLSLSMAAGTARYRDVVAVNAENRRLSLALIVGGGSLALAFAALFASSISAPIRRLAEAADRMARGDLAVGEVSATGSDEVAVLTRGFNSMSASIKAMVADLREKAELERLLHEENLERLEMGKALREAQFMHLQDRIRPHFLFNALNTIARSALLEEATETEALARSLGKLLRYSLAEGGAMVSLGEELDTLREYLSFQCIRFGARLRWRVSSGEGMEGIELPRLSLQPIVENAVRHGVEPKVEGGSVYVSARISGDRARLSVADTGVGMPAEILAELRRAAAGVASFPADPEPGAGRPGIGMANLEARLAYRYGGAARLAISSRPGRGTVVRISLPLRGRDDHGA